MRVRSAAALAALALLNAALVAQQPPRPAPPAAGQKPAFEVASIRPNVKDDPYAVNAMMVQGTTVMLSNLSLYNMLERVYGGGARGFQIDGPDWVRKERFDVIAKPPADETLSGPILLQMIRQLLADRFKLAIHFETKEGPIYELMFARSDRRPGPKLSVSTVDCAAKSKERQAAGLPGPAPECNYSDQPAFIKGGTREIGLLASLVSKRVGRQVVDRTGLTGPYMFEITFTPDNGGPPPPDAVSIFTALEDQLGLTLRAARGPVEFAVIDHAERAEEN